MAPGKHCRERLRTYKWHNLSTVNLTRHQVPELQIYKNSSYAPCKYMDLNLDFQLLGEEETGGKRSACFQFPYV